MVDPPDPLPPASETVRQRLVHELEARERDFETLRTLLDLTPRELEDELRHVERSSRGRGRRLRVVAPSCEDCGFLFEGRETRHLHPPGRCPACRGRRITPPRFRIGT